MSNIRYNPDPPYTDEELASIRECCSVLLSQWCVVRGRDRESQRRWDTIASPRYLPRIKENLDEIGFELTVMEAPGRQVAFLKGAYPQLRVQFNKSESIVLLRMYQILRNNLTKASLLQTGCMTDVKDILSAVQAHQKMKVDEKDIRRILYDLERFNLCSIEEKRKKNFSLNTQIRIFPSVEQFIGDKPVGWELEQLEMFKQERREQMDNEDQIGEEDENVD